MNSVEAQNNASERCPILRLPAELRLNIYRYALVEIGPSRVQLRDLEVPALLQSCRKIYLEASPVYFSENQFVLTVNIPPIAFYPKPLHSRVHRVVIPSWIKSLEEVAPVQMRNVKVEIDLAYKLGVITMGGDGSGGGRAGRLRVVEAWMYVSNALTHRRWKHCPRKRSCELIEHTDTMVVRSYLWDLCE